MNKLGTLLVRLDVQTTNTAKKTLNEEVTEFICASEVSELYLTLYQSFCAFLVFSFRPSLSFFAFPSPSALNELPPNCRLPALSSILIIPSLATTMPSRSAVMMEESANPSRGSSSSSHAPSSMNQFRALLWKNAIAKTRTQKVRTKCRRLPRPPLTGSPRLSARSEDFLTRVLTFSYSSFLSLHTPQPIPQLIPQPRQRSARFSLPY